MEQHHGHGHTHHLPTGRLLAWAFAATLGFAAIEAMGGFWAGSLALLSDAGHMLSDAAALGLAAFAAWLSLRPPSKRHSYGLGRAEVLVGVFNAATMLVIIVSITVAAVDRLQSPQSVSGATVMVIAVIGLIVNIVLAILLSRSEQTLNVRGALLHVIGDLLGSIAALIAGAVIMFTGWTPIDPILSIFVCTLILVSALRLLKESLHVMMEGVPRHIDIEKVGRSLAELPGIISVHDLHIWSVSSGNVALSCHVIIENPLQWPQILRRINHYLLETYDIHHTTIQPEHAVHYVPIPDTGLPRQYTHTDNP
jgi:cobalt-zinc-cadmium efflux system protein